jgi:hypothetical protein
MEVIKTNERFTGRSYLKKRFFGGFDVMLECEAQYVCMVTCELSPPFTYWRKASANELMLIDVKVKHH